jgi:3-methyladenine DNA glycosylase AlkD
MKNTLNLINKSLKSLSTKHRRDICQSFFQTQLGGYGEGDIFMGVTVPDTRLLCAKYKNDITLKEIQTLLKSKYHEERLLALFFLEYLYKKSKTKEDKRKIFEIYFENIGFSKGVNNWDLIDTSAYKIAGDYIYNYFSKKELKDFTDLCISHNDLWIRRMIIVASFYKIKQHDNKQIFYISKKLLNDKHHLIQKAVGWMLRESGKKCSELDLIKFIKDNKDKMSKITYSYAIERLRKVTEMM